MSRRRVTGFIDEQGAWRELRDPDAPATWLQLRRLNELGMLELVDAARVVTKAEAAAAVDAAVAAGLYTPRRRADPSERFDRVCRDVVAHVRAHPGCTTTSVLQAVHSARAYVGDRVRDLLELGVLDDRAARPGWRELHVNDNAGETPAGRSTT